VTAIPSTGLTARRYAEMHGITRNVAIAQLRAMGCEYRQDRWYPALTPHRSMEKFNAKVAKSTRT
jgi:hypothetical protein